MHQTSLTQTILAQSAGMHYQEALLLQLESNRMMQTSEISWTSTSVEFLDP